MGESINSIMNVGTYRSSAGISNANARIIRAQANNTATNLETEAISDTQIAALNSKRMRENQTTATAQARAERGASGLTAEGSSIIAEQSISDALEQTISDIANNNILSDYSKRNQATQVRFQGDLQAKEHETQAKIAKKAATTSLVIGSLGIGSGAFGGISQVSTDREAYNKNPDIDAKTGKPNPYGFGRSAKSFAKGYENHSSGSSKNNIAELFQSIFAQ